MAPRERLVEALEALKELQDKGVVAIHTSEIVKGSIRTLLVKKGFLKELPFQFSCDKTIIYKCIKTMIINNSTRRNYDPGKCCNVFNIAVEQLSAQ